MAVSMRQQMGMGRSSGGALAARACGAPRFAAPRTARMHTASRSSSFAGARVAVVQQQQARQQQRQQLSRRGGGARVEARYGGYRATAPPNVGERILAAVRITESECTIRGRACTRDGFSPRPSCLLLAESNRARDQAANAPPNTKHQHLQTTLTTPNNTHHTTPPPKQQRQQHQQQLPFLMPFLDAFSYARFLFFQFPPLARAVAPLAPLLQLYHSVPFAALIAFFGIYLGVVNNASLPRFVRFSAMQAVLLDILLVLPRLLEQLVAPPTAAGPALSAYVMTQNAIWVAVAAAVAYGIGAALLGKEARLPFIADAAEQQVR